MAQNRCYFFMWCLLSENGQREVRAINVEETWVEMSESDETGKKEEAIFCET